jgi:hypothetical protein
LLCVGDAANISWSITVSPRLPWTMPARRTPGDFLSELRRCRDHTDREQLAVRHPAITAAYQLHTQAGSWKRAELEARLLARESDETIAHKCHLSPAVVAAYHNLFFAVRPHLEAEFYIMSEAIGSRAFGPLTSADRDILLKLIGYSMGGLMVDQVLDDYADPPDCPADLTQLGDQALEKLQGKLRLRAMLLSVTMPADAGAVARLPALSHLLTHAGLLGTGVASAENRPCPAIHTALDFREFRPGPGAVAFNAEGPAGAEVVSSTRELDVQATLCLSDWQAVPA